MSSQETQVVFHKELWPFRSASVTEKRDLWQQFLMEGVQKETMLI